MSDSVRWSGNGEVNSGDGRCWGGGRMDVYVVGIGVESHDV